MYKTKDLFDLNKTMAKEYLDQYEYPWLALKGISDFILKLGSELDENEYQQTKENVWIHKSAKVMDSAYINGPTIIGENAEIRHCAFVRGPALIDKDCVVGNSCEIKNVIMFEHSEVPHFNYVGDSILGYKAHMGAGAVTSNLKADKKNIIIKDGEEQIQTEIKKMGAILGDNVEVGCNAVLNPGTIVGKNSNVYPTTCARGVIKENSILKNNGTIVDKK